MQKRNSGLTLIEIMISIALIAILATVYFVVANPAGQLAAARNGTRTNDLRAIALSLCQYVADQGNETFTCSSGSLPSTSTVIESSGGYNLAACLIPNYTPIFPVDPSASSASYVSAANYNTGYTIMQSASGAIMFGAPNAELKQSISYTAHCP